MKLEDFGLTKEERNEAFNKALEMQATILAKCEQINLSQEQKRWLETMVVSYMLAAESRSTLGRDMAESSIIDLDAIWDSVIK